MGIGSDIKIMFEDVEVAAEKVLSFTAKVGKSTPAAVAGLGIVLGAVDKAVVDVSSAAGSSGLNISLDAQSWADIKPIWPDVKALAATLGIKL
jgi:hypothetical protein